MTPLSVLTLAVPAILGICCVTAARALEEKITVILVGAVLGLSGITTIAMMASFSVGLTSELLWLLVAVGAIASAVVAWRFRIFAIWRRMHTDTATAIVLASMILLGALMAPKLLFENDHGLATGLVNAWGDLGWHMSSITLLAEQQSFPPENPIFAGTKLVYPFLSNFLSAMLLVAGATHVQCVVAPAIVLIPIFFTLFFVLAQRVSESRLAAVLSLALLVCGGSALGWTQLPQDLQANAQGVWDFFTHLPRDYAGSSNDTNGFHFLNIVTSSLLPQRSFLFGFPMAIAILLLLFSREPSGRRARFVVAGILSGLLPAAHGHTVIALVPAVGIHAFFDLRDGLFNLRDGGENWRAKFRDWMAYGVAAILIGLPAVSYLFGGGTESGSFLRWKPGWTVENYNLLWFWIKNTGLLLPAALLGLATRAPRAAKELSAAGLALFLTANLFAFAPWVWDNFKILIFWLIFSLPLIGWMAAKVLRVRPVVRPVWLRAVILILLSAHMLSGALDLWKISIPTAPAWTEWDREAIQFAEKVRESTEPGTDLVTAPYHNGPSALAGRAVYLGFPSHIWSHGKDPWERKKYLRAFYEGHLARLPETQPEYVVVGPAERAQFKVTLRPEWRLVTQSGDYSLYRIP